MSQEFLQWSSAWKQLKRRRGAPEDIREVLAQWRQRPPPSAFGRVFPDRMGARKNYDRPKGEQLIERQLLGPSGGPPPALPISGGTENLTLWSFFNNFAAAKLTRTTTQGQVIADAFGFIAIGRSLHPVCIEVKVEDSNCWGACVQNLQQVKFFRAWGADFLERLAPHAKDLHPAARKLRGVCGLVVAPPDYWRSDNRLSEARSLIATMGGETEARVMLASIDRDGRLTLVGGYKHAPSRP